MIYCGNLLWQSSLTLHECDNLAECLREMKTVVTVPEPIAMRTRRTVEAMLAIP